MKKLYIPFFVLSILVFALMLMSCYQQDASGTATETTNGVVIFAKDGLVAPQAKVMIYQKKDWIENSLNDSIQPNFLGYTDDKGYVEIPALEDDYYLHVEYGNSFKTQSVLKEKIYDSSDEKTDIVKVDTLELDDSKTILGVLDDFDAIRLVGTNIQAEFTSENEFTLSNVPLGMIQLILISENNLVAGPDLTIKSDLPGGTGTSIVTKMNLNQGEINLVDFTSGTYTSSLDWIGGEFEWYGTDDVNQKVSSENFLDQFMNSTQNALRMESSILNETIFTSPSWVVGFIQPSLEHGFDLSQYESIKLRVRGQGILNFALGTQMVDDFYTQDSVFPLKNLQTDIELPTDWQEIEIPLKSLQLPPEVFSGWGDTVVVQQVLMETLRMEWTLSKSQAQNIPQWVEMDQIKLKGAPTPLW